MSTIRPTGIPSAEAVGTPTITRGTTIRTTGIPSAEAFGHASVMHVIRAEGIPSAEAFGIPTIVRGVVEAVRPPGVTRADYVDLLDVLRGIRQDAADERAARRLESQAPMFARLIPYIRSPEGLAFVITVVIALVALIPPVVDMVAPDDPPIVVVEVDAPSTEDVERIVEDRLRELVESGAGLPEAE